MDPCFISGQTLQLVKAYAPAMGVELPADEESVSRICQNFYGQEVSYAMEAEEIRNRGGEWETAENISSMFASGPSSFRCFRTPSRSGTVIQD